jgi:putative flippase GtrA
MSIGMRMAVWYPAPPGGDVNPGPESSDTAGPTSGIRNALTRLGVYLRGDRWHAQLIRFALVGGLSNVGYFLLFMACYGIGPQLANLAGSMVSTAVANELHRRLTFQAADRVGWLTAQLEGGGLALAGLAITSAALALLNILVPHLGGIPDAIAVIFVTAAVGTVRFLTLRLWVF